MKSFQPTVDVLEDRICMSSVRLADQGRTLRITGDARANTVIMADNDFHGISVVSIDNKFYGPFDATRITKVIVNLGGGDDSFRFHTANEGGADFPPGYRYAKTFTINLGAGNDKVNYDFEWKDTIYPGIYSGISANLGLNIVAGAGNDDVFIRWGSVFANVNVNAAMGTGNDVFDSRVMGKVDDAARLTFNVRGEDGDDRIYADYIGQMDGVLDLALDGGRNNDEIRSYNTLPTQATGSVKGRVLGNAGDDRLDFRVGGFVPYFGAPRLTSTEVNAELTDLVFMQTESWTLDGLIDGGAGFDTFRKTANIGQVNCEQNV